MRPILFLVLALLAAIAVYTPGLSGPFVLDDPEALSPVGRWLTGQAHWQEVVLGYGSLLFARPVSMASFMLTSWLGGGGPFSFKFGNLIIHLLCGILGWLVVRRALREDARLAPHADLFATIVASWWLLHPLHVSTVLYAVQRMAQLSTLFVLASVWVYLAARRQLIDGRIRQASLLLFLLFPLLVLAGLFSKQNAAVAPALCLVLELAYFTVQPRPKRALHVFFGLFLGLPLLAGLGLLLIAPERLLDGYAAWDFTLGQRLLTQPRALMDYLGTLLLPYSPRMGLYTDDFAVSTGLLSPPTTLLAILALAGLSIAAIAVRKRAPSVFAGWFFFLVAHGVESTFLPIEMYYEHRNYLPSLGLLLAVVGLCALVPKGVRTTTFSLRQLGLFGASAFALALAFGTLGRALVWRQYDTIVEQALTHHPSSLRANLDKGTLALMGGRLDEGTRYFSALARSNNPQHRLLARINLVTTNCLRGSGGHKADMALIAADARPMLTIFETQTLQQLARVTSKQDCGEVTDLLIADTIVAMVDTAATQPDDSRPKWVARSIAAELYARAGHWRVAQTQAALAWQPNADLAVGVLLTRLYDFNGLPVEASTTLAQVERRTRPYDTLGQAEISKLRKLLMNRQGRHPSNSPPQPLP
jgi:hypothetical protein